MKKGFSLINKKEIIITESYTPRTQDIFGNRDTVESRVEKDLYTLVRA